MFTLARPTAAAIEKQVAAARELAPDGPGILKLRRAFGPSHDSVGFAHDHTRSKLGRGEGHFAAAKRAFEHWDMFNLGWVRVANAEVSIASGQIVAVEARTLGLWTLNLSCITQIVDTETAFGFIYSTTRMHVEHGEERFLVEFDPTTGNVWYELEALSHPRNTLARIGHPITRAFQRRFARDSHRRMRGSVVANFGVF